MRIVVNKHWRVYLDIGRAGSLSLQLYWTYHRLLHIRVAVNTHALPIYKKNRIALLLCIFEATILYQNILTPHPIKKKCQPRNSIVIPAFFLRKKGYINFVSKSVRRPSVRPSVSPSVCLSVRPSVRLSVCPSVRPCVRPSVTFLVNVSPLKPLEVATSNFVGE